MSAARCGTAIRAIQNYVKQQSAKTVSPATAFSTDGNYVIERLARKPRPALKIAVVYASDPPGETDEIIHRTATSRSWKSYQQVAENIAGSLRSSGFEHVVTMPDGMKLPGRLKATGIDLVWLNTGGIQGSSQICHAPALLEMIGIPYIGHHPLVMSLLDNKAAFKVGLLGHGLPTAKFYVWDPVLSRPEIEANPDFAKVFAGYDGPFIIKPITGRASQGVKVVRD